MRYPGQKAIYGLRVPWVRQFLPRDYVMRWLRGQELSRYRNAPDHCNLGHLGFQRGANDADDPNTQERRGGALQSTVDHSVDSAPHQVYRSRKPRKDDGCDSLWYRGVRTTAPPSERVQVRDTASADV